MSRALSMVVLGLSLGMAMPSEADRVKTVEVFTVSNRPAMGVTALTARGITVTVYLLDGIARVEEALSANLPAEPDAAKIVARSRLNGVSDHRELLASAANGLLASQRYGLDRNPAVVVDGKAIVYGRLDLEAVVALYAQSKGTP